MTIDEQTIEKWAYEDAPNKVLRALCMAWIHADLLHQNSGQYRAVILEPAIDEAVSKLWQPMETAPKDGTRILGWCRNHADICYLQNKHGVGYVWMTDSCVDFGGWENPTHWMPQPDAPTPT